MNAIVMWALAASAILGGIDKIFGNRLGLGKRFEDGFRLMGTLISGMVGILCLSPLITRALRLVLSPMFQKVGLDPAILGGILPIDMGGFQLAAELALDRQVGSFAGIFIASTFGCTIIFAIPVGFNMMKAERRPAFLQGILYGLIMLPVPMLAGGLYCGLSLRNVLLQSLPILLLALLLAAGMLFRSQMMIRFFTILAKIIDAVSVVGILAATTEHLTGVTLIPGILPLHEALLTSALCALIMIGSLPLAEIINRLLQKPLHALGRRIRMQDSGITALLLSPVSLSASFGVMHDCQDRDVAINAAFLVIAAAALGPHLAVVTTNASEFVTGFILIKLFSGLVCLLAAAYFLRRKDSKQA